MNKNIISIIAQVILIAILGMTVFAKFTDKPEVVELFAKLDMGPIGYKLIGFLELSACLILIIPRGAIWGAMLGWGLMSGAILGHITKLGFEGQMGVMAGMATVAWFLSILIIYLRKSQLSFISNMFGPKS